MAAKKIGAFIGAKTGGFSLLELVVVLAVMAVLLTLAIPSYRQYTQRAERAEAIRLMMAVAGCQERIRALSGLYDTTQCLGGVESDSYKLRIEPAANTASPIFEIVAVPEHGEGNTCGSLGLDHTGNRSISNENGTLSACWGGR